jgi:AcrR family transcriptional regulator
MVTKEQTKRKTEQVNPASKRIATPADERTTNPASERTTNPTSERTIRTVKPVEKRRQEILSTARRLFVKQGYRSTSVADIAGELGIAQGLVFHYFKSKAILLYTVIDQIAQEEQQSTRAFLEQHPGRAIDCLELFFNQQVQHHGYEALLNDLAADPAVEEYLQDKLARWTSPLLEELIERGNSDGSWQCDYPRETAIFIVQGFSGILKNRNDLDFSTMREAVQAIVSRLLGV